jgi:hypothetical protein
MLNVKRRCAPLNGCELSFALSDFTASRSAA